MRRLVNTHGFTEKDFERYAMKSVLSIHMLCPHCNAKPGQWCKHPSGRKYQRIHFARQQALFDRCKEVKDFVEGNV